MSSIFSSNSEAFASERGRGREREIYRNNTDEYLYSAWSNSNKVFVSFFNEYVLKSLYTVQYSLVRITLQSSVLISYSTEFTDLY